MESGIASGLELMERAGAAVAAEIRLRWPEPGRLCVMCGPGNNGGDGYVVARLLHRAGWQVRVLGIDNDAPPDAAEMKRRWLGIGSVEELTESELRREDDDVYVDAIFGTGLKRPLEGEIAALMHHIGGLDGDRGWYAERLIAVDCPSGLCLDSGAVLGALRNTDGNLPHARLTVTFDRPRLGHVLEMGPELCGELVVADIGLKWPLYGRGPARPAPLRLPDIAWLDGPSFCAGESRDQFAFKPEGLAKHSDDHKFSHGHVLIVAGGVEQGGAARLAAKAALRVGAGLVTIAPPADALAEHAGPPDALMRRAVDRPDDLAQRLEDKRITAVLLGPGCGIERAGVLLPVLLGSGRRCVLDADALTALARRREGLQGLHQDCVLTPHLGEFARLFPDIAEKLRGPQTPQFLRYKDLSPEDGMTVGDKMLQMQASIAAYNSSLADMRGPLYSKLDAVREASERAGCVILLKGPDTVIAGPGGPAFIHASVYDAAAPWLATAGSGDVLAGLIAGLMARGIAPNQAARMGAALHAEAARSFGPGLIADDLPDQIPVVFRELGL